MATNRDEILDLLAQGKITAEEAAEMLSGKATAAPEKTAAAADPTPEPPQAPTKAAPVAEKTAVSTQAPSWFRIRVRELDSGKNRVNVNIPVGMLKFGMKIGRRFTSEFDQLKWAEIDDMLNEMQTGMIVEVEDEDSNEQVQIFLE